MSVDAGTIWASIRIRLDKLNADVGQAVKKMDSMAASINNSGKSIENLNKLGSKLSLTVTAPIVAAGAAAVKFASDQNEALNAANVVFKDSAKTISAWGENAAKQAGLSKAEFYQSAAVTGAMLKGMGLTLDEAADKTIMLTKRAADMASIFNTDVKDSTAAVAAAIRGEMEPIRRYGVTLNQVTIQAKALAMGLYDGKGQIDSYAKAQATMALIMEQTNDIANDFVNTSDQQANATRILIAETKNQAAALGQQLLPYALQLIQGLRKLVDGFGAMGEAQRNTIIQVAALAAGMGPLVIGVSKAIQAATMLRVALVALSANPVMLTVAALAAATVGVVSLVNRNKEAASTNKTMKESTDSLITSTNTYRSSLEELERKGASLNTTERGLLETRKNLARLNIEKSLSELSASYKKTGEEIDGLKKKESERATNVQTYIDLMNRYNNILSGNATVQAEAAKAAGISIEGARMAYEKAAKQLEAENAKQIGAATKVEEAETGKREAILAVAQAVKAGIVDITLYRTTNKALYDEIMAVVDAKEELSKPSGVVGAGIAEDVSKLTEAQKEYTAALKQGQDLRRIGAIDDKELRELQIKAAEDYRDALVEIGYASEKEAGTKGQAALVAIIATLKSLGAETGSFDSLIEKVNALDTETAKTSSTMRQSLLNELNVAKAGGMGGDLFDELVNKVNAFYDELAKKEAMDQFKANLTFALDSANSMFGALSSLISATYDAKQERLEIDMAQELEANGLAEESAVQKAEKQVTEAEAAGNAEAAAEARKALKKAQIEEKYAKQKREIEYEGAMMVWDLQRAQAVTSGILAVMNAFAYGSNFGTIVAAAYAATAGLIAAIQVAAVDQSKPVKKYQTGGIVAPRGGGELGILGENGYTETLFNSGPSGQAFVRQMGEAIANYLYANQGTGESFTFVLDINAETVAKAVVPIIRDGNVRYTI